MSRRRFDGLRCVFSLAAGMALLAAAACATASPPPNIVLVLLDDFASSDLAYLPRLKALTSDRGTTYPMIVPSPRCAPSRASILTGRYAHNHGILGNGPGPGGWRNFRALEPNLVNCWLTDKGYATHYSGKYVNGYGSRPTYVPPCWTDWHVLTHPSGDRRYRFAINANGSVEQYDGDQYQTDVLSGKLASFIDRTSGPFFAVYAPYVPHLPLVPKRSYLGSFEALSFVRPPSFNEKDTSDKWIAEDRLTEDTINQIDARVKRRLEMMRSIEDAVAQLWQVLERRGLTDRTYVFVTSDNGYLHGEHRIAIGKGVPYREATEVPFIAIGPGIAAGEVSHRLIANHDLAPTISHLAGARPMPLVDGRSAVPLLFGRQHPWRRRVLLEQWNRHSGLTWSGIRSQHGVRIKWTEGPWESYDHRDDPHEMRGFNLEDRFMYALLSCAGDECRRLERIGSLSLLDEASQNVCRVSGHARDRGLGRSQSIAAFARALLDRHGAEPSSRN